MFSFQSKFANNMPITHHVAVSEGLHFACLHVHFVPKHSCCFCLLFLEARDSFFPVVLRETATANTIYPQRLAGLCLQIQCEVP